MQRSSRSLDVLVNPGGWTHQRLFSSISTFWQLRAVTSSPVRSPFLRRHQVIIPTAFSFSDGIQTHLNAGLPPDVEPFSDLEECDLDSDFDDPTEGDSAEPRPQVSPDASKSPQKSIKTYVVKYTAYRTSVGDQRKVHIPLTNVAQLARDNLVYLLGRDCFLQWFSRDPGCLRQIHLSVCG